MKSPLSKTFFRLSLFVLIFSTACKKNKINPNDGVKVFIVNELTGEPYPNVNVTLLERFEWLGYEGYGTYGKTDANGYCFLKKSLKKGQLYEIKMDDLFASTSGQQGYEWVADSPSFTYVFKLREIAHFTLSMENSNNPGTSTDSLYVRYRHEKLDFPDYELLYAGNDDLYYNDESYVGTNIFEFRLVRNGEVTYFTRTFDFEIGYSDQNDFDITY